MDALSELLRATNASPGSTVILSRLAEVLFAETLQRYVQQLPPGRTGWLAGGADPAIGTALAADALRSTSRNVLQVATAVGYESEAAFNRAFKRRFAKPPAQYRRCFREQQRVRAVRRA